jgi:hypothetical protein
MLAAEQVVKVFNGIVLPAIKSCAQFVEMCGKWGWYDPYMLW